MPKDEKEKVETTAPLSAPTAPARPKSTKVYIVLSTGLTDASGQLRREGEIVLETDLVDVARLLAIGGIAKAPAEAAEKA